MAINRAGTVGAYVSDQDRALDFCVNKLGFEKRLDEPMRPEARWIKVAATGAETRLVLFTPPGIGTVLAPLRA
jgi:catechol 2,3-dioxygenase-like lactoylglutathione lyase family enzyme